MLSKSMPERSAPQLGIGRARKSSSAWWRIARIQSGSDLWSEMTSTSSCESPFGAL